MRVVNAVAVILLVLAGVGVVGQGAPILAQAPGSSLGVNVSEPYSSTAFGIDGRWVFGDGTWSVSGFGSLVTVGDVSAGAWLGEAMVTRSLGPGSLGRHLFVGLGLRLNATERDPTEWAVPAVVGVRLPLVRRGAWDADFTGYFGVARRHLNGTNVTARANGIGLSIGWGALRLGVSHDDAAGSNSPFHYGGAAHVSIGARVR